MNAVVFVVNWRGNLFCLWHCTSPVRTCHLWCYFMPTFCSWWVRQWKCAQLGQEGVAVCKVLYLDRLCRLNDWTEVVPRPTRQIILQLPPIYSFYEPLAYNVLKLCCTAHLISDHTLYHATARNRTAFSAPPSWVNFEGELIVILEREILFWQRILICVKKYLRKNGSRVIWVIYERNFENLMQVFICIYSQVKVQRYSASVCGYLMKFIENYYSKGSLCTRNTRQIFRIVAVLYNHNYPTCKSNVFRFSGQANGQFFFFLNYSKFLNYPSPLSKKTLALNKSLNTLFQCAFRNSV